MKAPMLNVRVSTIIENKKIMFQDHWLQIEILPTALHSTKNLLFICIRELIKCKSEKVTVINYT